MADPVLLNDCKVWLGPYDLTGSVRGISLACSRAESPNSRMGDTAATFYPGNFSTTGGINGFFSSSAIASGEPDPVIWNRLSSYATGVPLTFAPPYSPTATAGSALNVAYVMCGPQLSYEPLSASHGDLLPYSVTAKPESGKKGLYRSIISVPKTTATNAATTGSIYRFGVLSASLKIVVTYHVFAIASGTSLVIALNSDDNAPFASSTSRGSVTVTTAGGITSGQFEVAGAIATDDYWRVTVTNTGAVAYTVAATMSLESV